MVIESAGPAGLQSVTLLLWSPLFLFAKQIYEPFMYVCLYDAL